MLMPGNDIRFTGKNIITPPSLDSSVIGSRNGGEKSCVYAKGREELKTLTITMHLFENSLSPP